ncbi:MAG: L-threonylcarbamoyladenylate synthase [Actinomycetota bacterium]|nr:L-threonylcarbamoyladenylate synthase [Actinomycetota bacterium]
MSSIDAAIDALRQAQPIVIPTDTVYGIAVLPHAAGAIEALFAAKRRPTNRPLPVLGESIADLRRVVTFDPRATAIGKRFWPGPLTAILPRAPAFIDYLGEGAETAVAVRVPRNEIALELLHQVGPLAVTSANLSGEPPALTYEEARAALGRVVPLVIDGGRMSGRASTIVSLIDEPALVREGEVSLSEVQSVIW